MPRCTSRKSELYPALAAPFALSQVDREEVLVGSSFVRQTIAAFGPGLQVDYTLFDFGARAGRIASARAELMAANFAFNDTHRRIIFQVADTYYRLLNAVGQVEAAEASLENAKTVQEAAENRLQNGLATLPDVLARLGAPPLKWSMTCSRLVGSRNCAWRPGHDAWDCANRQHPRAAARRTAGSRDARGFGRAVSGSRFGPTSRHAAAVGGDQGCGRESARGTCRLLSFREIRG